MSPCQLCGESFTVDENEKALLGKITFMFVKTKVPLPEPIHCPECRLRIRTSHRNERFLHRRKSDQSGKEIISIYRQNPSCPCTVVSQEEWHSDNWDALSFGREFDFSKPFFTQFAELQSAVPRPCVMTVANENCDYTTGTGYCKNCYLINSSEYCEDCLYGKLFQKCRSCMDSAYVYDSELCYEAFSVYGCYQCRFLRMSKNCSDCEYSSGLIGCKNCFLCTNLERKEYWIRNKPSDKTTFEKLTKETHGSWQKQEEAKRELEALIRSTPQRAANTLNCDGCTGDYLENSKNCVECFDVNGSQDCRNLTVGVETKDCYDCSNMYIKPELCAFTLGTIEAYATAYSLYVFHSQNVLYSDNCHHSKDLFGCVGMRRAKECILNKQYKKEEYEALVPKIVEHMKKSKEWGQFFPPSLSPFPYSETVAQEYLPLTKGEATKRGFHWQDTHDEPPKVSRVIDAASLPDTIDEIPDDILNWAITCESSGRPFRIQKAELELLKSLRIPVPRRHPDVRYDDRMKHRNPRKLWQRNCDSCKKLVSTTFAPDRPEKIVCESCYQKTVQ